MANRTELMRGSLLLFQTHEDYFAQHPKVAALRWHRIGVASLKEAEELDPDLRRMASVARKAVLAVLRNAKRRDGRHKRVSD
jgi:hypothetical protein